MKDTIKSQKRKALRGTLRLPGISKDIVIKKRIGEGASCICYDVRAKAPGDEEKHMLLKQFYPQPQLAETVITQKDGMLDIAGYAHNEALQTLGAAFENAYSLQNRLAGGEAKRFIVAPHEKLFLGATKYVLYEADWGDSLEKNAPRTLSQILSVGHQTALALSALHRQGVLYMDVKPENLLWVNRQVIKLFDFDAAVELAKLADLHSLRASTDRPELIAPEIRSMQCFEQNKGLYLTPRVDIFSLGGMLFHYLMGRPLTDEDSRSLAFDSPFKKRFSEHYRGQLGAAEQQRLLDILKKCICAPVGQRYQNADALASDLETLIADLHATKKVSRIDPRKVDRNLVAAYFLDENPLYRYVRTCEDKKVLDIMLVGEGSTGGASMREVFFKNIFACAQMLDVRMRFHMVADNAKEFAQRLLTKMPLLQSTVTVTFPMDEEDGKDLPQCVIDQNIVESPLAELYIYPVHIEPKDPCGDIAYLVGEYLQTWPGCFLLMEDNEEDNFAMAMQLKDACTVPTLIGVGDRRGDGFDLRDIEDTRYACVVPFSYDGVRGKHESMFGVDIRERALKIHTHYAKGNDERITAKEIEADFEDPRDNCYNLRSSLRSALAVPYKLDACGIYGNADIPGLFWEKALAANATAKRLLGQLMWLEHRSWQAFLIAEGWQCMDLDTMTQNAYCTLSRHKDSKNKLHPCLCASHITKTVLPLSTWDLDKWDDPAHDLSRLDPLDKMSVTLHRVCNDRIKAMAANGEPAQTLKKLEDAAALCGAVSHARAKELTAICQRMRDSEPNINALFSRVCKELEEAVKGDTAQDALNTDQRHALARLKDLQALMEVVEERNLYHDYKGSDEDVILAIPFIMLQKPIKRVYKLWSKRPWENIVSSLFIEPQELVLVLPDSEALPQSGDGTIENLQALFALRGNTEISITAMHLSYLKRTRKESVLDITGASARFLYDALQETLLPRHLIAYEKGCLHDIGGSYPNIRFYNHKRTLTVQETIAITGSRVYANRGQNQLESLHDDVLKLWKIAEEHPRWNLLCGILKRCSGAELPLTAPDPNNLPAACTYTSQTTAALGDLNRSGLSQVLARLQHSGVIHSFTLPNAAGPVTVQAWQESGDYRGFPMASFEKLMAAAADRSAMADRFTLTQKPNYMDPRMPLHCICDRHLGFAASLTVQTDYSGNETGVRIPQTNFFGVEDREPIERGRIYSWEIENLVNALHTAGLLLETAPNIPLCHNSGNTVKLDFRFASEAVRECLSTEGNVLEAFAYHTIRRMNLFDDVQLSVNIHWAEDGVAGAASTNEVDLICTKGVRTYFLSCKKRTNLSKDFLTEIVYEADHFGVDGVPVMLTTARKNWNEAVFARAERMQLPCVLLQLRANPTPPNRNHLEKELRRITREY